MLRKRFAGLIAEGICLVAIALALASCVGDTDGGSAADEDFSGTQFVDSDANVGGLTLNVNSTDVEVAGTTNFNVVVTNQAGQPVPQVRVSCDTESGLAILEPNTGSELTDSFGNMSGVLGCEVPGSLQIGCRLPIGANKRKFQTIHCTGAVPDGFTGFGGQTAGGGLGGGVNTDDSGGIGGTDTEGVRITAVEFLDGGILSESAASTTSIDIRAFECGSACSITDNSDDCTVEPFFDTYLRVSIVNNTNQTIRFTGLRYRIPEARGAGTSSFTSNTLSLIGEATAAPEGGTTTVLSLFMDAVNPTNALTSNGDKVFFGESFHIPDDFGFRNVSVTLVGTNGSGEAVQISGSTAVSFDDFNKCSD